MKRLITCALVLFLTSSCAAVLEDQVLPNAKITEGQQEITIDYKPLTYEVARSENTSPFVRDVIWAETGAAGLVSEAELLRNTPPKAMGPIPYRLGVGDILTLTRFVTTEIPGGAPQQYINTDNEIIISRAAKIGEDGSIFLVETGRVELEGETINEARNRISNALVRNGIDSRFDLAITNFGSQSVLFTIFGKIGASAGSSSVNGTSASFPITDVPLDLRQLLVTSRTPVISDSIQVAALIRDGRTYRMTFDHIFKASTPKYYLTGGDRVTVTFYNYRQPQGFLVGAIANPVAFPISPERRENLADILFVPGGAFATTTARQSEIYVLRGTNPVTAMHLDAKNPARVRIAAELELRPNDVVFVTQRPIISLNRTIAQLLLLDSAISELRN